MIHIGVLPQQEPSVTAADVEAWIRVQRTIIERQLTQKAADEDIVPPPSIGTMPQPDR